MPGHPGALDQAQAAPATEPNPMESANRPPVEFDDPMAAILGRGSPLGQLAGVQAPQAGTSQTPPVAPPVAPALEVSAKTKRSGGWVVAVAAVLLVGALGGAGWMFREPIRDLVSDLLPQLARTPTKQSPGAAQDKASPPTTASGPKASEKAPGTVAAFNPAEPAKSSTPTPQPGPSGGAPAEAPAPSLVVSPTAEEPARDPSAKDGSQVSAAETPAVVAQPSPLPAGSPPQITGTGDAEPGLTVMKPEPVTPATLEPTVPRAAIVEETIAIPDANAPLAGGLSAPQMSKVPGQDPLVEIRPQAPPVPEPPRQEDAPPGTRPGEPVIKTSPEGSAAVDSLRRFFSAGSLAERARYVLGAPGLQSLMERYYAKTTDGPIDVDEIALLRHDPTPETGHGAHFVFQVASRLWEFPIPVMMQEEKDGYKVDWLAFVEFKDNLLLKFLSDYQDMPARFHVGIRRTHYFEDDVPDRDQKDCFEIQPPVSNYVGYVFVPKNTPLAADLAKKISWETRMGYVIVELMWRKLGDYKWVELTGVPQLNWYSGAPTPQAASSVQEPSKPPPAPAASTAN